MHCRACDKVLTSFEATRKEKFTGDYPDMCLKCLPISNEIMDRLDLFSEEDLGDDGYWGDDMNSEYD